MTLEQLSYYIAMAGTVAFASSAVLAVADRKVDLFTAVVLGTITAIGGGTVRDMILDVPVFWSLDQNYVYVSVVVSILAFYASGFFRRKSIHRLFLYVDGFAVAMFAIQAMAKVWKLDFGVPTAPIALGVVTAIGGGLIRDVLVGRPTLLMSRELYAIPVLIGCILFAAVLHFAPEYGFLGAIVCVGVTFGIRAAAIRWNLHVPGWAIMGYKPSESYEADRGTGG
jgi:uncharacterized membrane protein YeiH